MESEIRAHIGRVSRALEAEGRVAEAGEALMRARERGAWVFSVGNGGSAATASHFANDFVKGLSVEGKKRFKAMCLSDCVPIVTALSNDFEYASCFTEQLKNYASPGDVLVAYSGSGNSPNVVAAAALARQTGMTVIAFTGRDGGKLARLADIACVAATDCMEEIEDVHMVWEHALVAALREKITAE